MDRELVLAILVALVCGSALATAAWCPTRASDASSGRVLERRAWRRMWLPLGPAGFLLAALCGWALVEPARAEQVPRCLLWSAVPFGAVLVRAAWRAVRSLTTAHPDVAVGTVGLLRPRVILSARLAAALDERALAAAYAHERAHARHWDPLRLWLAQRANDLLWPWAPAGARFRGWKHALEVARDEEARLGGIAGPDLAAAILAALRSDRGGTSLSAAGLGGDEGVLEERIARLLQPLVVEGPQRSHGALWLLALAVGVALAVLFGSEFGERVVRTLFAAV